MKRILSDFAREVKVSPPMGKDCGISLASALFDHLTGAWPADPRQQPCRLRAHRRRPGNRHANERRDKFATLDGFAPGKSCDRT
jgi:hypothetical protein